MKKVFFAVVVLLFALLFATCPDKKAHEDAIRDVLANMVGDKINVGSKSESGIASFIGSLLTSKVTEVVLDNKLQVNNYFIYSTGTIHIQGEDKLLSVGVLNHVFTFDEEDIEKALRNF